MGGLQFYSLQHGPTYLIGIFCDAVLNWLVKGEIMKTVSSPVLEVFSALIDHS